MREIRNEEKRMEREVNGKAKKSLFIATILLLCGGLVQATIVDVNIYSDAVIEDGDEYGTVNIYDTPPDQTTVTMMGGNVETCNIYDTAILDYTGGSIVDISVCDSGIAYISADGCQRLNLYGNTQAHVRNGYPGIQSQIFDDAELHVYGYDFTYYPSTTGTSDIYGTWENGISFHMMIRSPGEYDPYTQVILHEIPEPSSVLILSSLLLLTRYKRD